MTQPNGAELAAHSSEHRLRIESLSKRFGERFALDGVSFTVRSGEFVALLGPSGSGKTTLFRCLTGQARADSGRALLDGADVAGSSAKARRRVAMVSQQFALVDRLNVLDNVLAGRLGAVAPWRAVLRRFTRADRLFALQCLERVDLLEFAAQRADRLSGGQKQRVAIARALAQRPEVILADEPVASLDPALAGGILDLLRSIAQSSGVAVVCSLHQLPFAREYSDRIVGIRNGRIVVDSPTLDLDDATLERLYKRENVAG